VASDLSTIHVGDHSSWSMLIDFWQQILQTGILAWISTKKRPSVQQCPTRGMPFESNLLDRVPGLAVGRLP
jgi:hypothetical protein